MRQPGRGIATLRLREGHGIGDQRFTRRIAGGGEDKRGIGGGVRRLVPLNGGQITRVGHHGGVAAQLLKLVHALSSIRGGPRIIPRWLV